MDFNSIFFLTIFYTLIITLIIAELCIRRKRAKLLPDYNNSIPIIEIVKGLEQICPLSSTTKWKLIPLDYGSYRCWMQSASFPFIKNAVNLYGSSAVINSSSVNICSLIADVAKWSEWNPFYSSQYVMKSFHDKHLRRDHYMEAEQVVSVLRENNKIQTQTFMYRFHDFYENKVGWILFWNAKKCDFLFFLTQPIKSKNDNSVCLLTHIFGTDSKHSSSSASLVLQRLRNIKDLITLSSVNVVSSKFLSTIQPSLEKTSKHNTQVPSSNSQGNYFSLSAIRARKREVRNTVLILVPFVSHFFWKENVEFKLAVKNMDCLETETNDAPEKEKEHQSNSKVYSLGKAILRRTLSDVGSKFSALNNINSDSSNSERKSVFYVKDFTSKSTDSPTKPPKQNYDTTSEDSENMTQTERRKEIFKRSKSHSLSESAVNKLHECESSFKSNISLGEYINKLEDINENVEEKLVAMYEDNHKEMCNSSVSDYEVVENSEYNENRIAGFMTQGNYGASELQAEVLLASQFEHDNTGNFQFAGDWVFHSSFKGMCVLSKTTCTQFMKICSFLCQTEVPVAPVDVWKFVKNPQFRFICDESVKSVEVLEKISSSQKLIHTYHEVTGFLKKELMDFCLLQTEREELDKYYSCFYSIEFDKCPFMNFVTRGTLRPSGWIVEKSDKNINESKVTYMVQVLISSPDSLFIQELSTMVPQSVYNLKNYITSKPL